MLLFDCIMRYASARWTSRGKYHSSFIGILSRWPWHSWRHYVICYNWTRADITWRKLYRLFCMLRRSNKFGLFNFCRKTLSSMNDVMTSVWHSIVGIIPDCGNCAIINWKRYWCVLDRASIVSNPDCSQTSGSKMLLWFPLSLVAISNSFPLIFAARICHWWKVNQDRFAESNAVRSHDNIDGNIQQKGSRLSFCWALLR